MGTPPPVHQGRKGGFLWEELLRELPKDHEQLPFYTDDSGVAAAKEREAEVEAKIKSLLDAQQSATPSVKTTKKTNR